MILSILSWHEQEKLASIFLPKNDDIANDFSKVFNN
jgi:hypothetical protein